VCRLTLDVSAVPLTVHMLVSLVTSFIYVTRIWLSNLTCSRNMAFWFDLNWAV